MLPGQHLGEDDTERIDVRARVRGAAKQLFGRHVGGCPDGTAGTREARVDGAGVRDAEVDDFDGAIGGDQHILRFQIAVNDTGVVRGAQSTRDVCRNGHRVRGVERPARDVAPKGVALDVLRRHEQPAIDLLQGIDSGNGRM